MGGHFLPYLFAAVSGEVLLSASIEQPHRVPSNDRHFHSLCSMQALFLLILHMYLRSLSLELIASVRCQISI